MKLVKNDKFFNSNQNSNLKYYEMKDICSRLKVKKTNKGEMLYRYGDVGTKYYIILKGVASVIVPYGTNKQKIIQIASEFRDVTLDEYNE